MKGKLFLYLNSFSPREWKSFERFLVGVGKESVPDQVKLVGFWKERILSGQLVEPTKAEVADVLFPGQTVRAQEIRYLESDLVKSVEAWWIHQELRDDALLRRTILLRALSRRALPKPFNSLMKESEALLQQSEVRDLDYLFYRYRLNNLAFEFASRRENRGLDPGLHRIMGDLEEMYLSGTLKYGSILVNLANVVSSPVEPELVERLLAFGREATGKGFQGAEVYYHVLLTLVAPDQEEHYQRLLGTLEDGNDLFGQEEMGQLYAFALNYCVKKLNEGREDYLQKLFELYQRLLERRVIFDGNYILQQHFKNIVTTAIRLGEYAWTEAFLADYIRFVPPQDRTNSRTYNQAALHFAQRQYSAALRLLQQVEFTDVYYHVDSKALLLKTYYELAEWEPLLSLVEAFDIYLRRNRMISPYQQKVYRNFLKIAKKLVRKRLGSRKKVAEIKAEMEGVKEIADLGWLRLKAQEMGPQA